MQHNLGSAVCVPISDEVAINITNQATARLKDLQKDASAKKVFGNASGNLRFLSLLWFAGGRRGPNIKWHFFVLVTLKS